MQFALEFPVAGAWMTKLFVFIGATVGGWIGWFIGAPVGMFTAFAVSMVGTGVGMYAGKQIAKRYEG